MKLDQENLRPVIIAMTMYLVLVTMIPKLIKKPTGVNFVDDLVMLIISQQDAMMSGIILTGILVLGSNYINEEFF
jgi:hypothetical protein